MAPSQKRQRERERERERERPVARVKEGQFVATKTHGVDMPACVTQERTRTGRVSVIDRQIESQSE